MSAYKRKDHLYQEAKNTGLRSRAAFKLQELQKRCKLIERDYKIIDLGAWPGGWLQIAAQFVGPKGLVVGIDLKQIDEIASSQIRTLIGDVADEQIIREALEIAEGGFDLLLSDMSPKLTGIKSADRIAAVGCSELALYTAEQALRAGGSFVTKVFKSNEAEEFFRSVRTSFERIKRVELKLSLIHI